MQRYHDWYRDNEGRAIAYGLVTVYNAGTTTLATIFNEQGAITTPVSKSNPFTTDADGYFSFAAPGGSYDISLSASNQPARTIANVALYDAVSDPNTNVLGLLQDSIDPTHGDALVAVKQPYTGSTARTQHDKNKEYVTPEDFGAVGDGIVDDHSALQSAVTACCTSRKTLLLSSTNGYACSSTITLPSSSYGCTIEGQTRQSHIKFTGTGALFSATSTSHLQIRNLTLIGPGSTTNCTAILCATANYTVGTYYNVFEHITIEGFMYGMDISGLCNCTLFDINMGLSKSGLFSGGDLLASPLIGLKIGTTVLQCTCYNLSIFAKQYCVYQSTSSQLAEGIYFIGCVFDLHYNNGTASTQACVYWESGQDIKFLGCWMTNSAKYPAAGYADYMMNINHQIGSINAPMVGFIVSGCEFFGNGFNLSINSSVDSSVKIDDNTFVLYSDVSSTAPIKITGPRYGWTFSGNIIKASATSDGSGKYNFVNSLVQFSACALGVITGNRVLAADRLAVNTVTNGYFTLSNCSDVQVFGNSFPVQSALTPGSDIVLNGSNTDVVVIGEQQAQGRQIIVTGTASGSTGGTSNGIPDGTWNNGSGNLAVIVTGLTKPRMAVVEVYLANANVSSIGVLSIAGLVNASDTQFQITATGNQTIKYSCTGLVSGNVSLACASPLQFALSSGSTSNRHFKVTFI